ncbi:hypothetical protein [Puia dinghuensis]|uniref:Uncharacterized protein n=1 Tax=Puia dinghuensis TaxID=1792502 RepID=A0A8J2U8S0_9BACT|nr:hypothetical protein [Puia dinghuensis]GGA86851.1 hypothetical protein GCM10011511_07400 [Puia dinghuensis]
MNNSTKKDGPDTDLRSLLKNQHKKVYSICRLFAHNYKEHQHLFASIIAAASQNIRSRKANSEDKQTMLLRACINMAALHSISLEMEPAADRTIQFKSPDYQRCISQFRETMGSVSDIDKFRLFMEFEKVSPEEMNGLTGIDISKRTAPAKKESETARKNFIPYLKEKLIWS